MIPAGAMAAKAVAPVLFVSFQCCEMRDACNPFDMHPTWDLR